MGRRSKDKFENKIDSVMAQLVKTIAGLAVLDAVLFDSSCGDDYGIIEYFNDQLKAVADGDIR